MSEKLSFDWFIAKIHEVFDRLPDYRKFSPNLRGTGQNPGVLLYTGVRWRS